jgi:hypothetical protein
MERKDDMSRDGLDSILARWERLLAAAEANRKDVPYLKACRVQLGAEMDYVKALRDRKSALQAEIRQATQDLRVFVGRGKDLASRIEAGARAHYGIRSEKLTEFGIKLRRRRAAREKLRKEDEAPRNPTAL